MTFGYGASHYGFTTQLYDFLMTEGLGSRVGKNRAVITSACSYLSSVIWQALQETVKAAYDAKMWMREMVRAICKHTDRPIRWTAPTGFPVSQEYYKTELHRVKTILAGGTYTSSINIDTSKTDSSKHQNSISANFVHSLDTTALCKTVCLALGRGVKSFATIHDSYATVPADVGTLAICAREGFVGMYQDRDVLTGLNQELREQYTGANELPSPPPPGDLDLNNVLHAPYFLQ